MTIFPAAEDVIQELPASPPRGFVGRHRELAEIDRVLECRPWVALLGEYGEGKTTLAVECARRRVASGLARRVAYVSLEVHPDVRDVRFAIGQQLVPRYRLATTQDPRLAAQLLERVLAERPALIIFDHVEAVLPAPGRRSPSDLDLFEPDFLERLGGLWRELARVGATRLLFASRWALPAILFGDLEPVDEVEVGALEPTDAAELLERWCQPAELAAAEDLARPVGGHAWSLSGVAAALATETPERVRGRLGQLAANLPADRDDRYRFLLVGVGLALDRLPETMCDQIWPLVVFRDGGHLTAIAAVLGLDVENDEEIRLAERLIELGLAEMLPHNYLRLHPALADALAIDAASRGDLDVARSAWREAIGQLVDFLYQEQIKSPQLASGLAFLELPNLLAWLEHLAAGGAPEEVVEAAAKVAALVGPLGRPRALERVESIHERSSRRLGGWSHEQFLAESAALEALMDIGRPDETAAAARQLLHRAEILGEEAYAEAAFDLASLRLTLGLAQLMAGETEAARPTLEEARLGFGTVAATGNAEAGRMEARVMARIGDLLRSQNHLNTAVAHYESAIALAEFHSDRRQSAEIQAELGDLRFAQGENDKAIAAFEAARWSFSELGEARAVAAIWRQIAAVNEQAGHSPKAEDAYQQAIRLEAETGDPALAAQSLGELGRHYASIGRLREAIEAYRRAARIFRDLDDLEKEGIARSQMADKLLRLGEHDEARRQLERTIECDEFTGWAAEPWHTFSLLSHLETAAGDPAAAARARRRAFEAYLRYRRDGGSNQSGHSEIFEEVAAAIGRGVTREVAQRLTSMVSRPDLPSHLAALIPVLSEILEGSRERDLAAREGLYYRDAAEVLLLIDGLVGSEPAGF